MKIMFTNENLASKNIAEEIKKIDSRIELTEFEGGVLDVPTNFETDCILVLSSHKSKNPIPMLTVHVPGNWNKADFGGENRTLNIVHAELMKKLITRIKEKNEKTELNWEVYLECDHHGPNAKVPILFVEIGSTENEWNNKTAGKIIAESVMESLDDDSKYETVFCVGGGHYSRKYTKLILESEYAVGHILPKYYIETIDEELFKQAIEKNIGKVSKVFLDKECNKGQREKIKELGKKFELEIKEI